MNNIEDLLKKIHFEVGTVREAKKRFANQLAPDFSIFDFLRDDEMGLSACIAHLLNPKGKHGQGKVFLELLLKRLGWSNNIDDKCKVSTELSIANNRRIDIVVKANDFIIGIENKPWAEDQPNQLSDYAKYLDSINKPHWMLIYLSNHAPSKNSISPEEIENLYNKGNYLHLPYDELCQWLSECTKESKAISVRFFIEEIEKFVRTKINRELDMSEKEAVKNLLLNDVNNIQSAFDILGSMNPMKRELISKLDKDLKEYLKNSGLTVQGLEELRPKKSSRQNFRIFKNTSQNFDLCFEFDGSNLNSLLWGIKKRSDVKRTDAIWDSIHQIMAAKYHSGAQSNWWPWYSRDPEQLGDLPKNWESNPKPWINMQNEDLARQIASIASDVYKPFDVNENFKLLMGETK